MFFGRERELEELRKIVGRKPRALYFIYGPTNSGKTTLIKEFLKTLPDDYAPFYINLRGKFIEDYRDIVRAFFETEREFREKTLGGIPVPESKFQSILKEKTAFEYIERYFESLSKKPVLVIDEIHMAGEDGFALYRLFNFLTYLTKDTQLAHVFVVTSDSLFMDKVHGSTGFTPAVEYYLVDDFDYKTTKKFLEVHGFSESEVELVWEYFGGKPLYLWSAVDHKDKLDLYCRYRLGVRVRQVREFLKEMRRAMLYDGVVRLLQNFFERDTVRYSELTSELRECIEANILFADPVKAKIKPQSKLDLLAIRRVI